MIWVSHKNIPKMKLDFQNIDRDFRSLGHKVFGIRTNFSFIVFASIDWWPIVIRLQFLFQQFKGKMRTSKFFFVKRQDFCEKEPIQKVNL